MIQTIKFCGCFYLVNKKFLLILVLPAIRSFRLIDVSKMFLLFVLQRKIEINTKINKTLFKCLSSQTFK
ncbi:hypothetical protein BpHYR1_037166 [Brachionus plicatilis]|uniref:Uncharacterized protein n=1 Tax=Brachionus plicatilis TaxID=10195 RepID=A0A3M7REK1_BRAPC|nr:hypothetical protein BpHYR1_037166 [Brachionus plicatilis]